MVDAVSVAGLSDQYDRLLNVCDELEAVADGLPDRVLSAQLQHVATTVVAAVTETHRLEELVLFPILAGSPLADLGRMVDRFRNEHSHDDQAAMEINDVLLEFASGRSVLSPDAIGYLLRSFFESVRRHVHAEQDLLLIVTKFNIKGGSLH